MQRQAVVLLCSLSAILIAGCDGDSFSGFGIDEDAIAEGIAESFFSAEQTPFPDGHEHVIIMQSCEQLKYGRELSIPTFDPDVVFGNNSGSGNDHYHSLVITVDQQLEIRRGNPVVIKTNDQLHPHNWRIPANDCG